METTGLKSPKFRKIFAGIIAILMLAYVVCLSIPSFTYTQLDDKKLSATNADLEKGSKIKADWFGEDGKYDLSPSEYALGEKTINLNQYLWLIYQYGDLTRDVLPNIWKDANLPNKYNITSTIGFPLFSFLMAFVAAAVVYFVNKQFWNVLFSYIWSVGTIIGLIFSPIYSLFNPAVILVLFIVSTIVLILTIVYTIMVSIPLYKHFLANREKY